MACRFCKLFQVESLQKLFSRNPKSFLRCQLWAQGGPLGLEPLGTRDPAYPSYISSVYTKNGSSTFIGSNCVDCKRFMAKQYGGVLGLTEIQRLTWGPLRAISFRVETIECVFCYSLQGCPYLGILPRTSGPYGTNAPKVTTECFLEFLTWDKTLNDAIDYAACCFHDITIPL